MDPDTEVIINAINHSGVALALLNLGTAQSDKRNLGGAQEKFQDLLGENHPGRWWCRTTSRSQSCLCIVDRDFRAVILQISKLSWLFRRWLMSAFWYIEVVFRSVWATWGCR